MEKRPPWPREGPCGSGIWPSASIEELEGFASEVSSVAWRQDGAQIAAGDRSHTIRLWKGDFMPDGL